MLEQVVPLPAGYGPALPHAPGGESVQQDVQRVLQSPRRLVQRVRAQAREKVQLRQQPEGGGGRAGAIPRRLRP